AIARLPSARNRYVITPRCAGVKLTRSADLLVGIFDHFLPLGNPADSAGDCKQHGEHGGWKTHGLQRDPGIEVDIWIKLLFQEIVVVERNALELKRDFEQRIVLAAYFAQNLMAGFMEHCRARIVMLIYPMPEAHQTEGVVRILGAADKFWNALRLANFSQHVQRRL